VAGKIMRDAKRQLCMLISAQRNPTKKRNALIRQWAIEWRSSGFFVNAEELHYEAGPIRRRTLARNALRRLRPKSNRPDGPTAGTNKSTERISNLWRACPMEGPPAPASDSQHFG
jgi:hypothetical protein